MLVKEMIKALRLNRPALSKGLGSDFLRMYWFIGNEIVTSDTRMTIRTLLDKKPSFQGGLPDTLLPMLEDYKNHDLELTAKVSGEHVVFKAGPVNIRLPLSPAKNYDDIWPEGSNGAPEFSKTSATVLAKGFESALGAVFKVLGNDPSRLEYRGVTCILQEDEEGPFMGLYGFTGRTIGCDECDYKGKFALKEESFGRGNEAIKERRILLPDAWCAPALAMLSGAGTKDKAKICLSQHQIGIELGNTQMMIQAEAGRDEKPSDFVKQVGLARDAADNQKWLSFYKPNGDQSLMDEFDLALIHAHRIANGPLEKSRTLLEIKGGKATFSTSSSIGEVDQVISVKHVDGSGKFNPQWLLDNIKGFTHFALLPKMQLIMLAAPEEHPGRFFLCNAAGG